MSPGVRFPQIWTTEQPGPVRRKARDFFVCFLRMSCPIPCHYGHNSESPCSQQEEGKFSPGYVLAWEFLPKR